MTIRRYYGDSYTTSFQARVIEIGSPGSPPRAVLDETFFYPSSGGQPHDTGRLGSALVQNVEIREDDGAIVHHLDSALPEGPVAASLDWPRRLDHMQQHTGQHILSQAFLRQAGAPTIGFHLGQDMVSIDVETSRLNDSAVADAEALANEIVSRNLAVRSWFPAEAELATLALRKTPDVRGPLRVVGIGDFDFSACGGTHVAATGEIGLITVLRTERLTRGMRVEFLTGGRAREDYARKHALVRELSTALTCSPSELKTAVARLGSALVEARRQIFGLVERELDAEAGRRLDTAQRVGEIRIVCAAWDGRLIDEVKGLALRMTTLPGVIALLGVAGARTQLIFARSEAVAVELKPVFERTLATLGQGKGGGTRILQGAGGATTLERLEAVLAEAASQLPLPPLA
jgi:alanyl-tRNA synthetase